MIKVQIKFGIPPFQVDVPDEVPTGNVIKKEARLGSGIYLPEVKEVKQLKRSKKGSLHFRPGGVFFLTEDEWKWIQENRKQDLTVFIVLDDPKPPKKAVQAPSRTAPVPASRPAAPSTDGTGKSAKAKKSTK